MKIEQVNTHIIHCELLEPFHWAIGEATARGSCIVEVVTDTGLVGWGECFGPAGPAAAMVEAYKPGSSAPKRLPRRRSGKTSMPHIATRARKACPSAPSVVST